MRALAEHHSPRAEQLRRAKGFERLLRGEVAPLVHGQPHGRRAERAVERGVGPCAVEQPHAAQRALREQPLDDSEARAAQIAHLQHRRTQRRHPKGVRHRSVGHCAGRDEALPSRKERVAEIVVCILPKLAEAGEVRRLAVLARLRAVKDRVHTAPVQRYRGRPPAPKVANSHEEIAAAQTLGGVVQLRAARGRERNRAKLMPARVRLKAGDQRRPRGLVEKGR